MFWNIFFEGAIYLKFMVDDYFDCCFIFSWLLNNVAADLIIKVFTRRKTFAILTCLNTNLRCIKDCGLLWIKQMGRVCVSRISMKPCKFQGITAGSQGSLDKSRLCQNLWKEHKVKYACGKKTPNQNHSPSGTSKRNGNQK